MFCINTFIIMFVIIIFYLKWKKEPGKIIKVLEKKIERG